MGKVKRKSATQEEIRSRVRIEAGGCWVWTGAFDTSGSKRTPTLGGRSARVLAYEAFVGELLGLRVGVSCARCDCVSPEHLEAGTVGTATHKALPVVNAKRRERFAQQVSCRNGHPWDRFAAIDGKGRRTCRECARVRVAAARQAQPARADDF